MDWERFEEELVAGVVARVTARADEGLRLYAAVLGELYAEAGGVIRLPVLGVNSEEELAALGDEDLRWSLADWNTDWSPWPAEGRREHWERALTDEAACRSSPAHWQETFSRYLTALVRVCRRARARLRETGTTDEHFVVLVITDDQDEEEVLRRVLDAEELHRLFPACGTAER